MYFNKAYYMLKAVDIIQSVKSPKRKRSISLRKAEFCPLAIFRFQSQLFCVSPAQLFSVPILDYQTLQFPGPSLQNKSPSIYPCSFSPDSLKNPHSYRWIPQV